MVEPSRVYWEYAVEARKNATFVDDALITWVPGEEGVQACKTFMKTNEIVRADNKNMATDIAQNLDAVQVSHVICSGCRVKVSAQDITFRNLVSLEKRLLTIHMGLEGVKPMSRSVKCSVCVGPKTPIQVLNEFVQKHGYQLHMSLEMTMMAKDYVVTEGCQWKLGANENATKQALASKMIAKVRQEEDRRSKRQRINFVPETDKSLSEDSSSSGGLNVLVSTLRPE